MTLQARVALALEEERGGVLGILVGKALWFVRSDIGKAVLDAIEAHIDERVRRG